jgi:hypothetical protein
VSLLVRGTAAALERRLTPAPERAPITDPVRWAREGLNLAPWSVQREVMRKVAETGPDAPRRIGVPSGHGVGKTALAAWVAAWWIGEASYPGARFLVTSAPSDPQVKGLLWKEINRAHYRASLPGKITGLTSTSGPVTWHIGDELVGWGRKPQDLADPVQAMQAFQGIHAPEGVLVILDEATGVPDWLWKAALSLMTNESSRILAIGNPDDPSSTFAEYTAPGSGWWVRHISVFDSPLFTGEPVSEVARASLVGPAWVRDAEQDYGGTDNPLYQSKVLGLWPDVSNELVISPRLVRRAWENELPGRVRGTYGLDVARSPRGDWSALYRVRGGVARFVDAWRGLPITANDDEEDSTVSRTYRHVSQTPAVPVVVDVDGLGAGAYDGLKAKRDPSVPVVPFSAAGPARRPDRFDSRRSELWWDFREAMARGEVDLDPEDEQLAAQLQTPKWRLDGRGRRHVETKAELAKRGKKSPDRADAVIMGDAGAPIDLAGTGELGDTAPKVPRRRAVGGVPDALRVKPGESADLRRRRM